MGDLISKNDESVTFKQDDLANCSAFPLMDEIRKQGKFCDVTIKVEDRCFLAHRLVLCATIPYFNAMFAHDMLESRQKEVEVREIDPTAMESLIQFAYSGKVVIDPGNVRNLMIGASYLQLNQIRDACADYFKQRLECSNVLGILSLAENLSCCELVKTANSFLEHNFMQVVEEDTFVYMNLYQIQELLSRDTLNVNEETVFEAVIRWVKKDIDTRSKHLPNLLAQVRLPLLSPTPYLADCVEKEKLIRSCPRCRDLVNEAKDFHLLPERTDGKMSYRYRPRFGYAGLLYAVGLVRVGPLNVAAVEVMNPITASWKQMESIRRGGVGVAVLHNKLYAIGGNDDRGILNTVEVLDVSERQWSTVGSMNCKRRSAGAASLHGNIYVCGGWDDVQILNSAEKYDPSSDSWTFISPMTKNRKYTGVVALDNHIYVLGGYVYDRVLDSVEKYNPQTGLWSPGPSMIKKRCGFGVAVLDGKLYVCGGFDGTSKLRSVEVYDPRNNNKWRKVAPMNVKRMDVALAANDGKLWAVGGCTDNYTSAPDLSISAQDLSTVEVYDPKTDKWIFGPSMCALKGQVGLGVVPFSADDFSSHLP